MGKSAAVNKSIIMVAAFSDTPPSGMDRYSSTKAGGAKTLKLGLHNSRLP
jgi:hypothetical protein